MIPEKLTHHIYRFVKSFFLIIIALVPFMGQARLSRAITYIDSLKAESSDSIKAQFPGGKGAFAKFVLSHSRTPLTPQLKGRSNARVVARFVIDTAGQLIEPQVISPTDKHYNQEVLRILSKSPRWIPATIDGKKKSMRYTNPIKFKGTAKDVAGANVLLHGTLLRRQDIDKKTVGLYMPVRTFDVKFARALFGPTYRPLVLVDDISVDAADFDRKGYKRTLRKLEKIDTTKFDLLVDGDAYPFYRWKERLQVDSTAMILIDKKTRSSNPDILGSVCLLTPISLTERREVSNRDRMHKDEFLSYLRQYRAGTVALRSELMYIDDHHYNGQTIAQGLDTTLVYRVRFTPADVAAEKFQDSRSQGYFQVYTKRYETGRKEKDRAKLKEILTYYRNNGWVKEDYILYVNNRDGMDYHTLSQIPESYITQVNIISKEEATAIYGMKYDMPIIFVLYKTSD